MTPLRTVGLTGTMLSMPDVSTPLSLPADHLGLYIHVPFCVRKCRYCDFASQPVCQAPALTDRFLDALAREAAHRRAEITRPVHSLYLGGGTPTALSGSQLRRLWTEILASVPRMPDAEITIEANPGTLSDDVLAVLADIPLTRVSVGVQSGDAGLLSLLGRIHSVQDAAAAVAAVRALGKPQLNIDLMYGLPGQTPAHWEATLDQVLAWQPDHLSIYALILEEGTPLAAQVQAGELLLPAEEEDEQMAALTAERLAAAGIRHYEVSNAAHTGAVCRQNVGYWLGRDYLGWGPSAVSAVGAVRWRNVDEVTQYVACVTQDLPATAYAERLAAPARLLERVMLGLRLRDGFDLTAAETECGCSLDAVAGAVVQQLLDEGWLMHDGPIWRLSPAGYPLANIVLTRLMAAAG